MLSDIFYFPYKKRRLSLLHGSSDRLWLHIFRKKGGQLLTVLCFKRDYRLMEALPEN